MDYLEKYSYAPDLGRISSAIQAIVSNLDNMATPEILKRCFSFMDLTTLHPNDTVASVSKLVGKVNSLKTEYPDYPMPASICVFPNFVPVVCGCRRSDAIRVTSVAGCFPASQSFLEVKVKECEMAVLAGADEVDIVLALNAFLAGDYKSAGEEIRAIRCAVDAAAAKQGRTVVLKVILETGVLKTPENIAAASFLAMEAGADFIKTSTGKVEVNATPVAAYIMCESIRKYYAQTGRAVGFKAAGGISDSMDALSYYFIGETVLGEEWMNRDRFRFGVSRLGNSLMGAIEQKTVNYF